MLLVNPKTIGKRWHLAKLTVVGGVDKFHGSLIVDVCFKVDVVVAHVLDTPLMYMYGANDQLVVRDVVGICTLWNWKYVKFVV
jgi:hypothetical protein